MIHYFSAYDNLDLKDHVRKEYLANNNLINELIKSQSTEKDGYYMRMEQVRAEHYIFSELIDYSKKFDFIKVVDSRQSELEDIDCSSINVHYFDEQNVIFSVNVFPFVPNFSVIGIGSDQTYEFNYIESAKIIDQKLKQIYKPDTSSIIFINIRAFSPEAQIKFIRIVENTPYFEYNQAIVIWHALNEKSTSGLQVITPPEFDANSVSFKKFMKRIGRDLL
jgi:hypothetical protein